MIELTATGLAALRAHVEREWPREAGGLIVGGGFFALPNRHPEPERGYEFHQADLDGAAAVVHSHPDGAPFPSREDMKSQVAVGLPHGIVPMTGASVSATGAAAPDEPREVVAGEPFFWPDMDRPYVGRPYRHGVTDCFTLVRDWYRRECGIELPPVAYEWRWDETSPELDLYSSWRRRLGWSAVDPSRARPGDIVLLRMAGGAVADHAGVLLEDGLLLHHPSLKPYDPTSLSRRTPLSRLARWIVEVARPLEASS
ncbi:MAG: NlpC/P60 family protein [Acidobacteriota bacterium]|nr:NlpC/P60 family protein [Acidobacteriota bacterium]